MPKTRYIEAENVSKLNHGKFLLVGLDSADGAVESKIAGAPLYKSLPVVRRLGPILTDSVWMLELQTQEGMLFSPSWRGSPQEGPSVLTEDEIKATQSDGPVW